MSAVVHKDETRFLATVLDDEIVLMDTRNGDFLTLRGSAARIWQLIDGTRDRDAILAALCDAYDGPADRIAHELDAFLTQLRAAGFVREHNPAPHLAR